MKRESISAFVAKHAPDFCTVIVVCKGKLYSVKDATQSPSSHRRSRSSFSASSGPSIYRTVDVSELISHPDFDAVLPQTSMGVKNPTNSCTLEELLLPVHERVLIDSKKSFSSNIEIAENERHGDEALNEASFPLQRASKRCEEAVATVQAALRDLQKTLAEEVSRHQETRDELETQKRMVAEEVSRLQKTQNELATHKQMVESYAMAADVAKQQAQAEVSRCEDALLKLEEVTRKLEEECQRRRDAEERASQEAIAKREAFLALGREQQRYYSEYSFQELQSATNNFHDDNKLGEGGYGPVYKGKLHDTTVAIKVLARDSSQGREEFQKEVELLSHIRHPHMVMLRGSCPEKGYIVYEYMANGSLEDRLSCRNGTPPLPWYVRFRICLEVATALHFLHSRPHPIVHRDLKPGNILLDDHFVSKVGDVGVAKLVPKDLTFSITRYQASVLVGTLAYMDPDYQRTGVVSLESDVYSLGIIMLQLLTGRQARGVIDLIEDAVDNGKLVDVLDQSAGEWPLTEAMVLACLSLQCAEPRRKHRPNLESKVLRDLKSIQGVAGIAAAKMASAGQSSSGDW